MAIDPPLKEQENNEEIKCCHMWDRLTDEECDHIAAIIKRNTCKKLVLARNDITSQRSYPSEAKRRVVPAVPGRFSLA